MRLYLSSYKFGNYTNELVRLAGESKKVAIVTNAVDYGDRERLLTSLAEDIKVFNSLGFEAEELDLKKYFGKKELLKEYLSKFDMVWVRGGNTFILKRAYEQSGFDILIKELLRADKIVYGGYNAGVVILAPSMKGLEIVDDPNVVPAGYKPEFNWDGLNILNCAVCVHYRSSHPESEMVEKEVEYYKQNNVSYKTLHDGEVIVINGDKETFFGNSGINVKKWGAVAIILLNFPIPQIIQYFPSEERFEPDDYKQEYVRPFLHVGSVAGVSDTIYFQ